MKAIKVLINSDGITGREQNRYKKTIYIEYEWVDNPQWLVFEENVKSYTVIGSCKAGDVVEVEIVWLYLMGQIEEWCITAYPENRNPELTWKEAYKIVEAKPESKSTSFYPGWEYQPLFDLMMEHGLPLLQGEMDEIIECVKSLNLAENRKPWRLPTCLKFKSCFTVQFSYGHMPVIIFMAFCSRHIWHYKALPCPVMINSLIHI